MGSSEEEEVRERFDKSVDLAKKHGIVDPWLIEFSGKSEEEILEGLGLEKKFEERMKEHFRIAEIRHRVTMKKIANGTNLIRRKKRKLKVEK